MIRMEISNGPADERSISALEEALGDRLPEGYRCFLLIVNGGRPEEYEFLVQDWGVMVPLNSLLGVGLNGWNDVHFQVERLSDEIPREFIPIADDPAGNYLCIKIKGPNLGGIYLWDHESRAADYGLGAESTLLPLATSFDDFIENRLKPIRYT